MNKREHGATVRLASGVWGAFKANFINSRAFDLGFKVAAFAVLVPLVTWVTTRLISTSGHLSVSNDEILSFATSAVGLATAFIALSTTLALVFAEKVGLVLIGIGARAGERVRAVDAAWISLKRLPSLLGLALVQAAAYGGIIAAAVSLAALAHWLLPIRHDINYLISERPPVFWVAAVTAVLLAAAALAAFLVLLVRWIFAVPALLFERRGPVAALRASRRMVSGRWRWVAAVAGGWWAVVGLVAAVATLAFDAAGTFLLTRLGDHLDVSIAAVFVLMVLYLLVAEFVVYFGLAVGSFITAHLYCDIRVEEGQAAPALDQLLRSGESPTPLTRRQTALRIAGLLGAVVIVAVVATITAMGTIGLEDNVAITAHRGSSLAAPENTISAIELAIEHGADYAEIDVQETADGVVVLLHDEDLMRMAGVDRKIWEITYSELDGVDVGSRFAPEFAGERVPTLEEVIEVARDRIKLYIELKYTGHEQMLAQRVVRILEEHDFTPQAIVASLDYQAVVRVGELNPDLEVGYMVYGSFGDLAGLHVDFLSVSQRMVTERLVRSVHRNGKQIHAWTIDDPSRMAALIDIGLDNIITNDPATLRGVIDERAQLSDVEKLLLVFRNWLRSK
jgi:glycerophosphoryl diester phosphodiesterase